MQESIHRVNSILEALPYIKEFNQKIIVIKYGGAAMTKEELKNSFARDIVLLKYVGIFPIIVHGGGPEINSLLKNLNLSSTFIQGQRVTDKATMEVVEMILSGKVNKQIVSLINSNGGNSIGLSGRDGKLAIAEKTNVEVENEVGKLISVDLGLVGKIKKINIDLLHSLLKSDLIPVISPVAEDEEGNALNINADIMAGAIAGSMKAEKLILLTDTSGVILEGALAARLNQTQIKENIESGKISGGMIPKVNCCLEAISLGAKHAHIVDGRESHSILLEMFTDTGIGTMIG
ncbi:MAG: acetylglutamate kinase [Leptospiraceae bacterium]|nr:acetylglutamate kinase [Leptospiraceae bacterium]